MFQTFQNADPAIISALISTVIPTLVTIVGFIMTWIIRRQAARNKYIAERYFLAMSDIRFLLAVEEEHCKQHVANGDAHSKIIIRKKVLKSGLTWSGKNTPSRISQAQMKLVSPMAVQQAELDVTA